VLGLSPAPVFVVGGVILGQVFVLWTRRRMRRGLVPLVDLGVLQRPSERAAIYAMFIIVAMEASVNFTVPTYIQVVQGRTPFDTSMAMMPFNLTVFVTATLIVRFYTRFRPRSIALFSFALTTAALLWLAFVVTNNWETLPTILGLVVWGSARWRLSLPRDCLGTARRRSPILARRRSATDTMPAGGHARQCTSICPIPGIHVDYYLFAPSG
jgi:predicted MFS family arabinose efflux permease